MRGRDYRGGLKGGGSDGGDGVLGCGQIVLNGASSDRWGDGSPYIIKVNKDRHGTDSFKVFM